MKILGLYIERKTDILAFAAFLIALGSVLFQISAYVRGPSVRLFTPEQILISAHKFPNDKTYVRFGARMAYVNTGQVGYNATIRREVLRYTLGDQTYIQTWQRFIASDFDEEGHLELKDQGVAVPFPVNASSSLSHETHFTPVVVHCPGGPPNCEWANFLEWVLFLRKLRDLKEMTFHLIGEIYGEEPVEVACKIDVNPAMVAQLERAQWYAPSCWEIRDK